MQTLEFEGRTLNADKYSYMDYGRYLEAEFARKRIETYNSDNIFYYSRIQQFRDAILSRDIELEVDYQCQLARKNNGIIQGIITVIQNLKSQGFKFDTGEAVI